MADLSQNVPIVSEAIARITVGLLPTRVWRFSREISVPVIKNAVAWKFTALKYITSGRYPSFIHSVISRQPAMPAPRTAVRIPNIL